jgi:hypothetical protein
VTVWVLQEDLGLFHPVSFQVLQEPQAAVAFGMVVESISDVVAHLDGPQGDRPIPLLAFAVGQFAFLDQPIQKGDEIQLLAE